MPAQAPGRQVEIDLSAVTVDCRIRGGDVLGTECTFDLEESECIEQKFLLGAQAVIVDVLWRVPVG